MDMMIEKNIMKHVKRLSRRVIYCVLLLILKGNYVYSQGTNKLECIQGIWQGTNMDIEPFQELSDFYQIIHGDSIIAFYLSDNDIYISRFKFINFDIQEAEVDFYDVKESNTLSTDQNSNDSYIYTEIDQEGNVALDKYFSCGSTFLNKLHMEFQKEDYLPYSVYSFFKKNGPRFISQFNLENELIKAKIIVDKSYFHSRPDENTKRRAFVIRNDQVIIDKIKEDWMKVAYEGGTVVTEGWLKRSDVELIR